MTIYFDCPDDPAPIGGIKQIYRQVDVLARHGIAARVVHTAPGFRCRWFANTTPVRYAAELRPAAADRIVVPESRPAGEVPLHVRFPDVPRVVFNQNAYLTFKDADLLARLPGDYRGPYELPGTTAVLTVSEDSERVLRFLFPHLDVVRVRCGIDPAVFGFAEPKERLIAFVAKKSKILREVLHGLRVRGSLAGWTVVPIDHQPQSVVADIMRRCLVFLTAVGYEGFGLPPAEAMASGCVVVGFDGWGGAEYFTPDTGFPVPMGDVVGYAETVEDVLRRADTDRESLDALRRKAAAFVAAEYSLAAETASILAAWRRLLG
jgi:glycosyltransferase involved in cell wall biosynthesis